MMVGWLDFFRIPFAVILTKADKLPTSKLPRIVATSREGFAPFRQCRDVVPFSSMTGLGKADVLRLIGEHVLS
jgi:GTP-binding protein EngB required for normal cell division